MPFSIPVDDGSRIPHVVASSTLAVGAFRKVANLIGRCEATASGNATAAIAESVCLVIAGRQNSVPTDTGTGWVQGDVLYWDNTNFRFTKTSASNTKAGYAAADKASAATTADIILSNQG